MILKTLLARIEEKTKALAEFRPFEPPQLEETKRHYRIGVVFTSNAIEGFGYTGTETKILLEEGLTAAGKPLRDAFAVVGHGNAYDHMFELMGEGGVGEKDIRKLHSFFKGSLDYFSRPGEYRDINVHITGSDLKFPDWQDVPEMMKGVFDEYRSGIADSHPVLAAAWLHRQLVFVHPFADGNGRVARLAMNTSAIQKRYLPMMVPPLLRGEYIHALKSARHDNAPFYRFMAERQLDALTEYLYLFKPSKVQLDLRLDNSGGPPSPVVTRTGRPKPKPPKPKPKDGKDHSGRPRK